MAARCRLCDSRLKSGRRSPHETVEFPLRVSTMTKSPNCSASTRCPQKPETRADLARFYTDPIWNDVAAGIRQRWGVYPDQGGVFGTRIFWRNAWFHTSSVVAISARIPDAERLDVIATLTMHELGHMLLRLDHPVDHPSSCLHAPAVGLRYYDWHVDVRKNGPCPLQHRKLTSY